MTLKKQNPKTSHWSPLEIGSIRPTDKRIARVKISDGATRTYLDQAVKAERPVNFTVRGAAGIHTLTTLDAGGKEISREQFVLKPETRLACNRGPYAKLLQKLQQMIRGDGESHLWLINGRQYNILVCWSRDHVYTLKAAKYFTEDVISGMDYWLDSQLPNGMFWDCIYPNTNAPGESYLGEALGKGWFTYDDGMKYIVRRVPVLADTEYVFTEGVWYSWKASGDDAWMARQLPRLEKALKYMTTDSLRWSPKHGLVRRSFTADEWDFANSVYCQGDHRCIHPGDPQFFFHGNQSGMYAMYWRMAEMYEHLGNAKRAKELRKQGEGLRKRANAKLWFDTNYGHMIPETLSPKQVYDRVGDERKRMSLSTGYTINRGMPTHEMAVKTLKEYQRRLKANQGESFAEWWTMDPPYTSKQWPGQDHGGGGCPEGEYMNGGICTIIAGEIAKAAFDHGMEDYGTDILERVWDLCERDPDGLHQVYRRQPANTKVTPARFEFVDLRKIVNRGLRNGGPVEAWVGEKDNDLRNLPTGKRKFGVIEFDVIKPQANQGRAVLRFNPNEPETKVPVPNLTGKSLYFLHASVSGTGRHTVAGRYEVGYADGTVATIFIRNGHEIGHWWGVEEPMNRDRARVAWRGPNPSWKNVGMIMFGWDNPHPDKPIASVTLQAEPGGKGIILAAISVSDQPVKFQTRIRSYGLPDCWAQGAVYYAIAEGLAGIEDKGRAFDRVKVSPRWAASAANEADVTLHYPASNGYCSYRYKDDRRGRITLELTGSFLHADVHCLLPRGKKAKGVEVASKAVPFHNVRVEKSNYVDFALDSMPEGPVIIRT